MKIALIDVADNTGDYPAVFEEAIRGKAQELSVKKKTALDMLDVIALAKRFSAESDYVAIFVEETGENKARFGAFYEGLAVLEAETGKEIVKCIVKEGEDGEALAKEAAEKFINYVFYPGKLKEKKAAKKEEKFDFG